MSKGFSQILLALLLIVCVLVSVTLLYLIKFKPELVGLETTQPAIKQPVGGIEYKDNNCQYNLANDRGEEFFANYTVIQGDSLVSIANKIYSDSSRVADIVEMNKYIDDSLSTDSPYVEVGWKLLLPPKDIRVTSTGIRVSAGLLHTKRDGSEWFIQVDKNHIFHVYPNSKTYSSFNEGDCIIIYDEYYEATGEPLKVILQSDLDSYINDIT